MFTTGSKLLISAATFAVGLAVVYGLTVGGALGTLGLTFAAVGLILLAIVVVFTRDANVSAMDHDAFASAGASDASARRSLWPIMLGAGVVAVSVGLITNAAIVVVGLVLVVASAVEWMVQTWSERASAEAGYNKKVREDLADPLELPVGAALLGAIVAFGFSRVLLGLPSKTATVIAFAVAAALVFLIGSLFGTRRRFSRQAMTGAMSLGVIAIIAVGSIYGIRGGRHVERHETTAELAEADECGVEETHADKNASQTVSAMSSLAAEVDFDGSALTADVPGYGDNYDALTLPSGNDNHIVFHNRSDEPARLVLDLHPFVDPAADPAAPAPTERVCSAITEPGGSQFLTVRFSRPTFAVEADTGEGYAFEVAGSEARLEVTVP